MWYSQGTVSATNNNPVINGVGTDFLQGVRVGDGITIQGSTSLHEVMSIASATQMTIKPAYTGATGSGKQYAVAPILGYDKDLSDAFNQLRLQFGDKLSSLQPWAHAATASAALDSLGFSSSGKVIATGDSEAALDSLGFSSSGKVIATGTPEQGRVALGVNDLLQTTGTSTDSPMSQKAVTDAINNSSIGVGQTWQNMTENRRMDTAYTNTTGRTIEVSISVYATQDTPEFSLSIDDVLVGQCWPNVVVGSQMSAVVPAGSSYYTFSEPVGLSNFNVWSELR